MLGSLAVTSLTALADEDHRDHDWNDNYWHHNHYGYCTVNEAIGVTTSTIMNSSESAHSPLKQGAEPLLVAGSSARTLSFGLSAN